MKSENIVKTGTCLHSQPLIPIVGIPALAFYRQKAAREHDLDGHPDSRPLD
jgi:hypothetical protein